MYIIMNEEIIRKIIDRYFQDNKTALVQHHIDSYNDFFSNGIYSIFKEKNPIRILKKYNKDTEDFDLKCNLFLGGKGGDKLYFGKPMIYDEGRSHFMYPNEARLRNMTYGITIHYDVDVEFIIDNGEPRIETLSKVFLGRFPIMLMSDLCILNKLSPSVRFELGECRNDRGGYFIIDGKEKCIVSQEKFADNMLYVRDKVNDLYSHSSEIRSVSEDASKPVRTLAVRMVAPSATYSNEQIVVEVPNVRKPVPLFILMRALGVESDKDIIDYCLLNTDKFKSYVDLFIPSVHDAGKVFTQVVALKYIATLTKGKTVAHVMEILSNYFLPHIGEMNFLDKAYFLGHMVKELLKVYTKNTKPTDRDSFKFKRVELTGSLMYDLFKEYYTIQQKNIFQKIDKEYHYHTGNYNNSANFTGLIMLNQKNIFSERKVETGFKKAMKGNWGSQEHTKKVGVVQDLNRLSFNSALSHLRKISLPLDASAKVIGPRLLHPSQFGIIDPVDTPDGGNVGLHKHLALMAYITSSCPSSPMIKWLRLNARVLMLGENTPFQNSFMTKIFVNGAWIGVVSEPQKTVDLLKSHRRSALIPVYTSINWEISNNIIYINTDAGRLCRPIFYMENGRASYDRDAIMDKLKSGDFTWNQLITGFAPKKTEVDAEANQLKKCHYMKVSELYETTDIKDLSITNAIIEYIDTSETDGALISMRPEKLDAKKYTHVEIHPSFMFGIMGNQVIFPENNPLPRDLFACGQMKQAVSLYHSNYQNRIDKMGVVLNNGQTPLIKSIYLDKICGEQHPYGENVVVAIMSYNGYNVEDSILFNEGSLKRGLFRTTYFNMYETREENSSIGDSEVDSKFANIENENVTKPKTGYDYSYLDENGLIRENTYINEHTVLVGKIMTTPNDPDIAIDASVFPKKGQLGYVDKSFFTEGEEGGRLAKIRVRNERIPNIGDKFCSRCGQKGTIGLVIPEENMPFTESGLKPDIIINPHALPSRMTIGQLVETLMGKASTIIGGFGDCTAFMNKGPKHEEYGAILKDHGFHSSGCELMYNGETGEQIETNIYVGPTYYMRLKHMVKDKINYRARGPRTVLTRQTVQGRANDGGLRIGEMERDGVLGHGASKFLQESMLVRGDDYKMAVCNQSGMIAIYNENKNLFISPYSDGPLKFSGSSVEDIKIANLTKYGRSFSVVRVPYSLKLMMQELQCMNIQMRIITEDNIDQLSSMVNSNNLTDLLGEKATAATVASNSRAVLSKSQRNANNRMAAPTEIVSDYAVADSLSETPEGDITPEGDKPPPKTTIDPSEIGWKFMPDTDSDVWGSLIIKADGRESDFWDNESNGFKNPEELPLGWVASEAIYEDGTPIPSTILSQQLNLIQEPNNWKRAIEASRALKGKPIMSPQANSFVEPGAPTYEPPSTMFNDTPQYGEDSPEYVPDDTDSPKYGDGEVSPAYVGDDDSPEYKVATPDKQGEGIKLNIQENLTNISDRILGIIDSGKRSILDINNNDDKTKEAENDESKPSAGEKKIITTDLN